MYTASDAIYYLLDTTDIIEQVILSEGDVVVSNQKLRKTMPTAEARDIIAAASKGA